MKMLPIFAHIFICCPLVAHVKRSVELAATCMNISESDVFHPDEGEAAISTDNHLISM
jgi:hypothetical protein